MHNVGTQEHLEEVIFGVCHPNHRCPSQTTGSCSSHFTVIADISQKINRERQIWSMSYLTFSQNANSSTGCYTSLVNSLKNPVLKTRLGSLTTSKILESWSQGRKILSKCDGVSVDLVRNIFCELWEEKLVHAWAFMAWGQAFGGLD